MNSFTLIKPTSKPITNYYGRLEQMGEHRISNEMGVREAFKDLLHDTVKTTTKWAFLTEQRMPGTSGQIQLDAEFRDDYYQQRGVWEGKDNLEAEIVKKIAKGYPRKNTIFEDTRRAVLYQNGRCFH
jgi:hypothetical protein